MEENERSLTNKEHKLLKRQIVEWLKTKSAKDIIYVKKNPEITIFAKHPGMTYYDSEKLLDEPEQNILSVERTISHEDRLLIIRHFSKKWNTTYLILDPFYSSLERKFQQKVAIITFYPSFKQGGTQ